MRTGRLQGTLGVTLPGHVGGVLAALSRLPRSGILVAMARARACPGRAAARRAALRSVRTAGKVGNGLRRRHRDSRKAADQADPNSTSTSPRSVAEKRTSEKVSRSWLLQGIMTPVE